jgi:glycosyltransferase involved in cell wall biosynthesis
MALARPVVSTSLGADGIPATHGEHLMIADDAASFAEACIGLLLDADAARTMGLAAKRFAEERYSWRAFVDKLTVWAAEIQHRLAGDQP